MLGGPQELENTVNTDVLPHRARPEPPRAAQSARRAAQSAPRAAQSAPRAPQSALRAAQSAPRGRLCALSAAQSLLVAACARSEPARDRLCPRHRCCSARLLGRLRLCVRISSSKKLFEKAVSGLLHSALLNSVLLSSVNVYSQVHTSIYIYIP